jgi:hypothetical protein
MRFDIDEIEIGNGKQIPKPDGQEKAAPQNLKRERQRP